MTKNGDNTSYSHEWERKVIERAKKWGAPLAAMALLLPLIFFTGQIISHSAQEKDYQPWRIAVEGYDPRHLLKGRFIRYRYAFDWTGGAAAQSCTGFAQSCCLCLTGAQAAPQARLLNCDTTEIRRCDAVLEGIKGRSGGLVDFGLREYYVDERAAKVLDQLLRSGEVRMSVDLLLAPKDDNGQPQITEKARLGVLYVNGRALSDMLQDGSLPLGK